jgi:glycerol-3-phosphate dehydrogenase (NAD(P)+)
MISVLGSGRWGTALAFIAARNNLKEKVFLWGRGSSYKNVFPGFQLPVNIHFTNNLAMAVHNAKFLIIAVPSNAFGTLIKQVVPYIDIKKHNIILATKGLDHSTNKFFSQIVGELVAPDFPLGILSGPSFAKEVIEDLPTAVMLAFEDQHRTTINQLIQRLNTPHFKVYPSNDLIGVQLGGVFKNVLAVVTGISDGLGFGANSRAALITMGLAEIFPLATKLQVNNNTIVGLAGLGDMILTCSDSQSRNYKFGYLLAQGHSIESARLEIGQAIEALDNISALYHLAVAYQVKMPMVELVWNIVYKKVKLLESIEILLTIGFSDL